MSDLVRWLLDGVQTGALVWLIWKQRTGTSTLHLDVSALRERVVKLESESGRMTAFRGQVFDRLAKLDQSMETVTKLIRDAIDEMRGLAKALVERDRQLQGDITAIRREVGMDPKYPGGQ